MLEHQAPIQLNMTQHEAAAMIEAVHDSLFRKVRWTISPAYEQWHSLDFQIARTSIEAAASVYGSLYMAFREDISEEDDPISPSFETAFLISNEVWEIIDQIREATDWDEVERHLHGETLCKACRELNRIPKA